jgi:hypothetical protein
MAFFIDCTYESKNNTVNCKLRRKVAYPSAIASFATAGYMDPEQGYRHYFMFVLEEEENTVRVIDYSYGFELLNITYFGHYEAEITDIATSNGFLYVLRGIVKTIDVYQIFQCERNVNCQPIFQINAETLRPFGVQYFGPQQLITDAAHPEVLFIRCKGEVIVLDIDNQNKMVLLREIKYSVTMNYFYRVAVNRRHLTIISDPDIVDLFSLDRIYTRHQDMAAKMLPLYGYTIQQTSEIEFSDFDTLIYVSAVHPVFKTSAVLVYRTDRPAAASLHAIL